MRRFETMDGNGAAAYVSYAFSEVAAIYPITPSSPMAEMVDAWSVTGRKNIFGKPIIVDELQSEAGASAAVHGALKTGVLATTYTASQGLLLMLPNMYKIAGELLPAVFHVASRTVATSALSIFGDHSDVMATRQTGFAMLVEGSVQEVMDLAPVAHLSAILGRVPFVNFFDGFRTSHELQKIEVLEYDKLAKLFPYEAYEEFKQQKMNPNHPHISGTAQNGDIHFQQRELSNKYYEQIPKIVHNYMQEINKIRGTDYDLVNYYGASDAKEVIIAMGSVTPTLKQTVDYLNNEQNRKVGMISIHLYRPFPSEALRTSLPKTVTKIAVLDRTKEPGSDGEPLLEDVKSALYYHPTRPIVIGGRYGLASKDVTPDQLISVYDELTKDFTDLKQKFTVGIEDDITNYSLPKKQILDLTPSNTYQALFYGYGSDGTVGGTKQALKIIADNNAKYVQGYFVYDSKKSGGLTVSHMRVSDNPISSTYLVKKSDYIGCHNAHYLYKYDLLETIKDGGTFVLNTQWDNEQILTHLPKKIKQQIALKKLKFYVIDAYKLALKLDLNRHINTIMTETFFLVTKILPEKLATNELIQLVKKMYAHKGEVVKKNIEAILETKDALQKVDYPSDWEKLEIKEEVTKEDSYLTEIAKPMLEGKGDNIKVSTLEKYNMTDGRISLGTAKDESQVPALEVPHWDFAKCTQCNECSFICPHAAIRPIVLDEIEKEKAPKGYITQDFKGEDGLYYRIQVAVDKCTGCSLCVDACPSGALTMKPYDEEKEQAINWAFSMTIKQKQIASKATTTKSTQFKQPLLEFSGACSGCGETIYVKLLTQLYGERLMIANATGCSSIWGASSPTTPYTTNECGQGPAWSNSLLEDAAEYGYGMYLANNLHREKVKEKIEEVLNQNIGSEVLQELMQNFIENFDESEGTLQRADKLTKQLEKEANANKLLVEILKEQDVFAKPSQWIIGGDGWAYDIGYSGVDHLLASGANINLLVLDNEVYANTGGQVSKATPEAAIAKFAAGGKRSVKKDLGQMAMVYDNVYVAQVSANANPMQTIKAFEEAEKFDGPSIIIAYTPCIAHGLIGGMKNASKEAREAVESGYWALYRYNPKANKKMSLDYKRPNFNKIFDFLKTQTRFNALSKIDKDLANELYTKIQSHAKERFFSYANKAGLEEKLRQKLDGDKEGHEEKSTAEERAKKREQRRAERLAKRKNKI